MNFENKQQSLLTFRVGPVLCCAPSFPVQSIITPPKLTHPPGSDSAQPGIFKHGSHIVKVIDLRQKFGIDQNEQTQPGNLIITLFEKESFAFWVDQILDVFDFPTEGWGSIPAAIPRGVFTRTLLLNKKIHLYSEFEKLATIQELGYLKNYLQQLKQQENKKVVTAESSSIIKSTTFNNTNDEKRSVTSTAPIKPTELKTKISVETTPANTTNVDNKTFVTKPVVTKKEKLDTLIHKGSISTSHTSSTTKPALTEINLAKEKTVFQNTSSGKSNEKKTSLENDAVRNTPIINKSTTGNNLSSRNITNTLITPETQSYKNTTKTERIMNEEESSSMGLIIFFLIIFGLFGSGIYFIFFYNPINTSKINQPYIANEPQEYHVPISIEKDEAIIIPNQEETKMASLTQDISNTEENVPDLETSTPAHTEQKEIKDEKYRAEIIQEENEITITLHEPLPVKETPRENIPTVVKEKVSVEEELTISPNPVENIKPIEEIKAVPVKKQINEIIHIVVKGDTLWAIAKKYVDNPFLYPELARLSNIKNPHRIYPGNKVRIRFIKNQ